MRVLHFGDLHVWRARVPWRDALYPKAWLGPLNLLLRRARKFPPSYRRPVMEALWREEADLVVFTGDFSTFSLEEEFQEAAEWFGPLREKWGDRLFALPGNHDRYTPGALRRRHLERWLPWVRTDPLSRLELEDGWTLLGVDHSVPLPFRSNGVVTPESLPALADALAAEGSAGRKVLLAGHFPYATPAAHPETWEHRLIGGEAFAEVLRAFPPAAYLHGHKHVRWALRPAVTPETLCLNCGSAGMRHTDPLRQAGYVSFHLGEEGVEEAHWHRYDGRGGWEKGPLTPDPA